MSGVVHLIRHGESVSDAGQPSSDPETIELTETGRKQSLQLAQRWSEAPELIVTSSFVRSQQTAAPFCARFPLVPVEIWGVHEFIFINLKSSGAATTREERRPLVNAYWNRCDPDEKHSNAESFREFWNRVAAFHRQLEELAGKSVVVLSHGFTMRAFAYGHNHGFETCSRELMRAVYAWQPPEPYVNTCVVRYQLPLSAKSSAPGRIA
jgi:broad specificity phosphatase PhoE